jgi:hypothetical protein
MKNILHKFKKNKLKYFLIFSSFLILCTSFICFLYFFIKFLLNLNSIQNKSFYLLSSLLLIILISSEFLFYKIYHAKNLIDLDEANLIDLDEAKDRIEINNENLIKNYYKENKYSKIKHLINIRWINRILAITLVIISSIIISIGSKNSNYLYILFPVLFIATIILIFILINNYLSYKIDRDINIFDKEILSLMNDLLEIIIKENEKSETEKDLNTLYNQINDYFIVFNQLILERNFITRNISIENFQDSYKSYDQNDFLSLGKKFCLYFAKIFHSLAENLTNFANQNNNINSLEMKNIPVGKNFNIFKEALLFLYKEKNENIIQFIKNIKIEDKIEDNIIEINKNNNFLLKPKSIHNYIISGIDNVNFLENLYKIF